MGISGHVQELGVQVRFSLEIEQQVYKVGGYLIYQAFVELHAHHARRAGERTQPGGAFRTTQVTKGSRFYAQLDGITPVIISLGDTGAVERMVNVISVAELPPGNRTL